MPQSPTDWPSVMYHWKYKRNKSAGKVLAGIFFWRASSVCKTVSVCLFFLPRKVAMEMKITDDQYFDRRISSVMLSVKILLTNCVFYTDRINPSIKLFNGEVFFFKA
jgi:hypothetical protein